MIIVVAIVAGFLLEASSSAPNQCSSQVGQHITTATFDEVRAHLPTVAPRGPYESTSEYENRLAAAQSSAGGPVVTIVDNGVGFDDINMGSFSTAYSEHKLDRGGKGLGRLLWLKAFDKVEIDSV